jgi:hypothetical protein
MFDDAVNLSRPHNRSMEDSLLDADNIIGNTAHKYAGLVRTVSQSALVVGTIALILARRIKNNPVGAELSIHERSQHGIWLLAASSRAQEQCHNEALK